MELCIYIFHASSYYTMDYGNVSISASSEDLAWQHLLTYVKAQEKESEEDNDDINSDTVMSHFTLFKKIRLNDISEGFVIGTNLPLEEDASF